MKELGLIPVSRLVAARVEMGLEFWKSGTAVAVVAAGFDIKVAAAIRPAILRSQWYRRHVSFGGDFGRLRCRL